MSTAADAAKSVALSDNSASLTTPASVAIAQGASTGTFTMTSAVVAVQTVVVVGATYSGVTKSATLYLIPAPKLSSCTVNPTSVQGGVNATGTVTLDRWAPSGGQIVTLTDNSANITVPTSVQVVGGQTAISFTVTTTAVGVAQTKTISATYRGVTKTATLTLTP